VSSGPGSRRTVSTRRHVGIGRLVASWGVIVLGAAGSPASCAPKDASSPSDVVSVSEGTCDEHPTVLVEHQAEIPDAGAGDIVIRTAPVIAVRGEHLYFLLQWQLSGPAGTRHEGYLMRVPLGGGPVERLAALPTAAMASPSALVLTDTDAFLIRPASMDGGNAALLKVPIHGGDPQIVVEAAGDAEALALHGTNLYFADREGLKSIPHAGGSLRLLVPKGETVQLVALGSMLYLASPDRISAVPTGGGEPMTLVEEGSHRLIACGAAVCWFGGGARAATLMQLAPGETPRMLTNALNEPHDMLFDGSQFFVTTGRGAIRRLPADGGALESVYAESGATGLALAGRCLYWAGVRTISTIATGAPPK